MAFMPATWDMYDLIQAFFQAPTYHIYLEVALVLICIKLFFSQSYAPEKVTLTEAEEEELIREYKPEPLAPDVPDDHPVLEFQDKYCVQGCPGKFMNINGKDCLNVATLNFLGMVGDKSIEEAALKTLQIYGVGSCGPRGFYGTMDVHLELEDKFAAFMNTEEAILYSYGFATIASAIPAYCKRGDIIFCDEGVSFSIQKGMVASRSTVKYFKHNNMEDLERLLKKQEQDDKKNPKKAKVTRKFIVVEGLYMNHGDICPLPKLVELKWQYKVRIFLEESLSFGVLGQAGRGVTEHFNIAVDEVDLIAASLENSIGSVGGFCCGKKFVIDHQRLSGSGYCFSASLPPMLASAATQALNLLQQDPTMLVSLQENCRLMHAGLSKIPGVSVRGDVRSPVKHVQLSEPSDVRDIDMQTLQMVVEKVIEKGVAMTVARYLEKEEHYPPQPSIRVSVNSKLTATDISRVVDTLKESFHEVFSTTRGLAEASSPQGEA